MHHRIASARQITLAGQLDRRLRLGVARLAEDDIFDETFVLQDLARRPDQPRQFEEYAGDLSGRYIGTLAACAAYTGAHYARLQRVVQTVPGLQRATGLVGTDLPVDAIDFPVIWGQGRLLAGLVDYHAVFGSAEILACAQHLGDFYARCAAAWSAPQTRTHPDFSYYTQGIEGLVGLFRATGQASYLATAQAMGMLWLEQSADRPIANLHSHAFLLTLLGLLDVHEASAQTALLEAAQSTTAALAATMLFVDGAPPEFFPWSERTEACSIVDWLHLNLRLGFLTHQAHYFDTAERVWRNALYSNQAANGGFCHRHFRADRLGYTGEGCEAWWCCSFHGPRGYVRLLEYLYTSTDDDVWVHFVEPSTVTLDLPRGRVRIAQQTSYPSQGDLVVRVLEAPLDGVRLRVRVPAWSALEQVLLNDTPADYAVEDGYLRLVDRVRAGDAVSVSLRIGLRVESDGSPLATLWWGPLLMTCDSPGGPPHALAIPSADALGLVHLPPLEPLDHPYAIAGTHFAVIGTGNPVAPPIASLNVNQPQFGRLRPLADQTGFPAAPPAVVRGPVIVAEGTLAAELQRLLGYRR